MSAHPLSPQVQTCLQSICQPVSAIFAALQHMELVLREHWHSASSRGAAVDARSIQLLRPQIDQLLQQLPLCAGAGLVFAPGVVSGEDLFMEWRRNHGAGEIDSLQINLKRHSPHCFDYEQLPWFSQPRQQQKAGVSGPYVDLHCTGKYALTFSIPVMVDGEFIAVVAADVQLCQFEPLAARSLLQLAGDAVLLSGEGRVIASNTPNWGVGDLASALQQSTGVQRAEIAQAGWSLLYLPA